MVLSGARCRAAKPIIGLHKNPVLEDQIMLKNYETTVQYAENLLATVFSGPIKLVVCDKFDSRHNVLRCKLIGKLENRPKCVIIKHMSIGGQTESPLQNLDFFLNELACLRLFNGLQNPYKIGPRLYCSRKDIGLLILEDLGKHQTLREILLGKDSHLASEKLIQYGRYLGKVHVALIGKEAEFKKLSGEVSQSSSLSIQAQDLRIRIDELLTCFEALKINASSAFVEAIESLETIIYDERNPFRTWTHRDLRPLNILCLENAQIQLVDFELASYGHALLDAVSVRMAFPPPPAPVISGGKTIPSSVIQSFEENYRTELSKGIPEAGDDNFFQAALTQACAHWALIKLLSLWEIYLKGRLSQGKSYDSQDDIALHQEAYARFCQQGIAYLHIFKDTAEDYDQLPVIRSGVQLVISALGRIWPEIKPLPLFPAFQNTISRC